MEKFFKSAYNYILQKIGLILPNNEIEESKHNMDRILKILKQNIRTYYVDVDYLDVKPEFHAMGITDVEFSFIKKYGNLWIPTLHITLERPGLLIGRGGSNIDSLRDFLRESTGIDDLEINIIESKLWKNLY